jgi:hypothetical protein
MARNHAAAAASSGASAGIWSGSSDRRLHLRQISSRRCQARVVASGKLSTRVSKFDHSVRLDLAVHNDPAARRDHHEVAQLLIIRGGKTHWGRLWRMFSCSARWPS